MTLRQQKVDSHIILAMLAYMIWPTSHDIEFDNVGERKQERKQNRNVWWKFKSS
jgi:hypothetical protein